MSQSLRAVLVLAFFISLMISFVVWMRDASDGDTWRNRWIAGGATIVILAVLLRSEFRKDQVPDLLKEEHGRYYERDGFCFSVNLARVEGESVFQVHFQNRYEGDCEAVVQI